MAAVSSVNNSEKGRYALKEISIEDYKHIDEIKNSSTINQKAKDLIKESMRDNKITNYEYELIEGLIKDIEKEEETKEVQKIKDGLK